MRTPRFSLSSLVIGLLLGSSFTVFAASRAGSSIFPDVTPGAYYDVAIGEMADMGIITGFGDGTFKPDEPLTRGQAAVLMKRLRDNVLGITPTPASSSSSSTRTRSSSSSSERSSSSSSSSSSVASTTYNEHGKFRFTTNTYKADEDEGYVTVTVVRTGGKEGLANVNYKLKDDSAKASSDFEAQEGTLVFSANETSKSFQVRLFDDEEKEGDEKFTIELSNPTGGAELTEPKVSTFTVIDDESVIEETSAAAAEGPEEGTFMFSAQAYSVPESGNEIRIYVSRVGGSKGEAKVDYKTDDGTAKSGSDYTKTTGTLTFAAGETEKSFTIGIDDDTSIGGNKAFDVELSSPTGGAVLDPDYKRATVTVFDDEVGSFGSGSFKFAKSEFTGEEAVGFVNIIVTRQGGSAGDATVNYETTDGTAKDNSDYESVEGTLTFKRGEVEKYFTVKILNDTVSDGGETVNLKLTNAIGAGLTTPTFATLKLY